MQINQKIRRVFDDAVSVCRRVLDHWMGHRFGPTETYYKAITYGEAKELLQRDVERCERVLRKLVRVPLEDPQEASLVSFIFNVGAAVFQRSTLRMKVNREEHDDVPAEFKRWVWCKGRKLAGLVARREAEATGMGGGEEDL